MEPLSRRRSGFFDLFSVVDLYCILSAAELVFSRGLAENLSGAGAPLGATAAILIALSCAIAALAVYSVVRSARSRDGSAAGGRFRIRLIGLFAAVALLASAPQALVFWSALDGAASTWFNARIEGAIKGGERLSLDYADLMRENLAAVAERSLPGLAPRYAPDDAEGLLSRLRDLDPRIAAAQIFPAEGGRAAPASSAGAEPYWERFSGAAMYGDGELPSRDTQGGYAIRYRKETDAGGRRWAVVIALEFPAYWTAISEDLNAASRESSAVSAVIPRYRTALALLYVLLAAPLLLAAALFAAVASDLASKPLDAIERAISGVASGELGTRLLARPRDDFAGLMTSFNRMVADLGRSRSAIVQAEKLSAWQDIAQKLAHEIKNPLTPIRLSAERVLKRHRAEPASTSEILEPAMLSIIQEVDGLAALLEEFRDFARLPEPQFEWTDLGGVASEVARSLASGHPGVRIDLAGIAPGVVIRADRGHIRQLFMNLFLNAIDAMEGEGSISVRSDLVKRPESRYCRIQISDTGPGIPASLKDKLFTPYFTTKQKGTGLGLSIVEHIVIDHKGEVWFESEEGSGATFFIDLPVDDAMGNADRGDHANRIGN